MSYPDHDTFQPGGRAWELSEDAIHHLINNRPDHAQRAIDAMTREMLNNGAGAKDVRDWEATIHIQAQEKDLNVEWTDGADGPDPGDYLSADGNYENVFEGRDVLKTLRPDGTHSTDEDIQF